MLYLVKLQNQNETLLKLGFTSKNTTAKRFQPYNKAFDDVELLKTFTNPLVDWKSIEKLLNDHILLPHKIKPITEFGGYSECYSMKDFAVLEESILKYSSSVAIPL